MAPVGDRSQVGRVRLDQEPVGRAQRGRGSHVVGGLEGDDAGEGQVGAEVEGIAGPRSVRR